MLSGQGPVRAAEKLHAACDECSEYLELGSHISLTHLNNTQGHES